MNKKSFFLKLKANRPTFAQDMTNDERAIMQQHVGYLTELLNKGIIIVFGPVFDPTEVYGMAVLQVDSEDQVRDIIQNDPASKINRYEFYPMKAVLPDK